MKMKTIVIALAAVVSSSAMAWTPNSTGGTVEFSGTLTPVNLITPWAVKTGTLANLSVDVKKGLTSAVIKAPAGALVLGIRAVDASGIITSDGGNLPQIDFGGKLDLANAVAGKAPLVVDVMDATGANKIGSLQTQVLMNAGMSVDLPGYTPVTQSLFAGTAGTAAFFGGLPTSADKASVGAAGRAKITAIDPEVTAYFKVTATDNAQAAEHDLANGVTWNMNAYYGAGIEQNDDITLTLDTPVAGDTPIQWKASLPVSVSYM